MSLPQISPTTAQYPHNLATIDLPAVGSRFEEQLRSGYYTGILETYGVQWSLEKVARDTLQNFFDPYLSLDPVSIQVEKRGLPLFRTYCVRIEADAQYNYQKLLHMGGTGKSDQETTAGGFGEGAKILALVLLRDFKFSQVRFGSGSWQLDFYLAEPPAGSYDEKVRGLHCKLTQVPHRDGNFVELLCDSQRYADEFLRAKSLFYHRANPDFADPTMVVKLPQGGEIGFKLLTREGRYHHEEGHLYDAGQRRHYKTDDQWRGLEGLHAWTVGFRAFHRDRDRGAVSSEAFKSQLLRPLINAMNKDQIKQTIEKMECVWPSSKLRSYEAIYDLLQGLISEAAYKGIQFAFAPKYLASNYLVDSESDRYLESKGFVLCDSSFKKLGMKDALTVINEFKTKVKVDPSREEIERIEVLKESAALLKKLAATPPQYRYQIKDIWLFEQREANQHLLGQHSDKNVWISRQHLGKDYASALATYLHEVLHDHGGDGTRAFGYALTDTLGIVIDVLTREADQFKPLVQRWHRAQPAKPHK